MKRPKIWSCSAELGDAVNIHSSVLEEVNKYFNTLEEVMLKPKEYWIEKAKQQYWNEIHNDEVLTDNQIEAHAFDLLTDAIKEATK